jgi:hypothetical protein
MHPYPCGYCKIFFICFVNYSLGKGSWSIGEEVLKMKTTVVSVNFNKNIVSCLRCPCHNLQKFITMFSSIFSGVIFKLYYKAQHTSLTLVNYPCKMELQMSLRLCSTFLWIKHIKSMRVVHLIFIIQGVIIFNDIVDAMEEHTFNTNIYSYMETSGSQNSNLY